MIPDTSGVAWVEIGRAAAKRIAGAVEGRLKSTESFRVCFGSGKAITAATWTIDGVSAVGRDSDAEGTTYRANAKHPAIAPLLTGKERAL